MQKGIYLWADRYRKKYTSIGVTVFKDIRTFIIFYLPSGVKNIYIVT